MKIIKEKVLTVVPSWYHIADMSLGLDHQIKTRVSRAEKKTFDRLAKSLRVTTSHLLREALMEKLAAQSITKGAA